MKPIPGITGHAHEGVVMLEFDGDAASLPAPGGGQYLPCTECGRVFVVPDDAHEIECSDCASAREITADELVAILRERGPHLISELAALLRERRGIGYLSNRQVRELFWRAQDEWPDQIVGHKLQNDSDDLYLEFQDRRER